MRDFEFVLTLARGFAVPEEAIHAGLNAALAGSPARRETEAVPAADAPQAREALPLAPNVRARSSATRRAS